MWPGRKERSRVRLRGQKDVKNILKLSVAEREAFIKSQMITHRRAGKSNCQVALSNKRVPVLPEGQKTIALQTKRIGYLTRLENDMAVKNITKFARKVCDSYWHPIEFTKRDSRIVQTWAYEVENILNRFLPSTDPQKDPLFLLGKKLQWLPASYTCMAQLKGEVDSIVETWTEDGMFDRDNVDYFSEHDEAEEPYLELKMDDDQDAFLKLQSVAESIEFQKIREKSAARVLHRTLTCYCAYQTLLKAGQLHKQVKSFQTYRLLTLGLFSVVPDFTPDSTVQDVVDCIEQQVIFTKKRNTDKSVNYQYGIPTLYDLVHHSRTFSREITDKTLCNLKLIMKDSWKNVLHTAATKVSRWWNNYCFWVECKKQSDVSRMIRNAEREKQARLNARQQQRRKQTRKKTVQPDSENNSAVEKEALTPAPPVLKKSSTTSASLAESVARWKLRRSTNMEGYVSVHATKFMDDDVVEDPLPCLQRLSIHLRALESSAGCSSKDQKPQQVSHYQSGSKFIQDTLQEIQEERAKSLKAKAVREVSLQPIKQKDISPFGEESNAPTIVKRHVDTVPETIEKPSLLVAKAGSFFIPQVAASPTTTKTDGSASTINRRQEKFQIPNRQEIDFERLHALEINATAQDTGSKAPPISPLKDTSISPRPPSTVTKRRKKPTCKKRSNVPVAAVAHLSTQPRFVLNRSTMKVEQSHNALLLSKSSAVNEQPDDNVQVDDLDEMVSSCMGLMYANTSTAPPQNNQ